MLKILEGNPEKLEGKAMIYTKVVDGDAEMYPSIFVAPDPAGLFGLLGNYFNIPPEYRENMEKEYSRSMRMHERVIQAHLKFVEKIEEYIPDESRNGPLGELPSIMKDSIVKHPFVMCCGLVEDIGGEWTGTMDIDGDVVRLGDLKCSYAHSSLDNASKLYMGHFYSQQEGMLHVPEGYVSPLKTFREMGIAEFKDNLYRLAGELMHAVESGEDTSRVTGDMKQLSHGAPFVKNIVNFCQLATTNHPHRSELMMLHLDIVNAILDEDYETAYGKRREIEELR